jgi:hypothetical protein
VFHDLTEAHTLFLCELSEGLAFKYFFIRHLNQAHRQYVDSDALAFASSYSPSIRCVLYLDVGWVSSVLEERSRSVSKTYHRGTEDTEREGF